MKKKIIIYDLEMPETALIQRFCAMFHRVPLDWMKNGTTIKGKKLDMTQRKLMNDYMSDLRDFMGDRLIIRGPSTLSEIEADIATHEPDIITVDTVQAMTDVERIRRGESTTDQLARIASGLQMFAKKYNIAVGEVSQVTKENQTNIPKIGDIIGSSVIGTKAANIIAVRDRYKCTRKDEDVDGYDAFIRKSRHGLDGQYRLTMNKEIALISEFDKVDNLEIALEKGI
jgi:replicative DNA helicase